MGGRVASSRLLGRSGSRASSCSRLQRGVALFAARRLRRAPARDVLGLPALDRDAKASHRPASLVRRFLLANDHGDPSTGRALWAAHQARLEREVDAIRVAPPSSPRMAERDPYAAPLRRGDARLRRGSGSSPDPRWYGRLAAAFDWRRRSDEAVAAVDLGAASTRGSTLLAHTAGRPPLVIDVKTADPQTLTVPEDLVLVVHGDPSLVRDAHRREYRPLGTEKRNASLLRPQERSDRKALDDPGAGQGEDDLARRANPPRSPSSPSHAGWRADDLVSTEDPAASQPHRLADTGLHGDPGSIRARQRPGGLRPPAPRLRSSAAHAGPAAPGGPATAADGQRRRRRAHDRRSLRASVGGRQGDDAAQRRQHFGQDRRERPDRNDAAAAHLPQPSRARWSEQRRDLILDPDTAPKRAGFETAPDRASSISAGIVFDTPANIYLGLKQAKTSLEHAQQRRCELLDVAALLWAMAQQIEDGDASQAERDLRAAEQALREALQRGASDEEIRKLMEQLRA